MMKMVANASPLIFSAKIHQLALLEDYRILVPSQVVAEIEEGKNKPERVQILCFLEGTNISVEEVELMDALPKSLGTGERSAISLAVERKIPSILLDERRARRIARFYGLDPKGTLWVLKEAQRKRRLCREEVEELVFELVRKGFRIKEELLIAFLKSI